MPCYFFSGREYIRVLRGYTGPGDVEIGYPAPISNWGWPTIPGTQVRFGAGGIDAALYSGAKDYFFSGPWYIRVTRGRTGPGTPDGGYPAPIANWGWPVIPGTNQRFGAAGIDAALYSGSKCYFFSGAEFIRVTRGETGAGAVDSAYPAPIANWGWPKLPDGTGRFGTQGIDAALYSGPKCYFFSDRWYVRVTRGDTGPGGGPRLPRGALEVEMGLVRDERTQARGCALQRGRRSS